MPNIEFGLTLKPTHAIVYQQREISTQLKEKSTLPSYDSLDKWTKTIMTRETYEAIHKTEKKIKPPTNHLQNLLSMKSQQRIKNAVNLLLECADEKTVYSKKENITFNYKVGFMTLTIPADCVLPDETIHYKIFKPFIRVLRDKYDLAEYLWKAETQENGQLHYHITINVFIHWYNINQEWNKQIEKQGYIFKSVSHERASTEIHSTKNVKNMAAYLCGYVAKKDEWKKNTPKKIIEKAEWNKNEGIIDDDFEREIEQYKKRIPDIKLWDCSLNLKKQKCSFRNITTNEKELIIELSQVVNEEIQNDYYSVWIFDKKKFRNNIYLYYRWWKYIDNIKMKNKQKKKYVVLSMMVSDEEYNIIFDN